MNKKPSKTRNSQASSRAAPNKRSAADVDRVPPPSTPSSFLHYHQHLQQPPLQPFDLPLLPMPPSSASSTSILPLNPYSFPVFDSYPPSSFPHYQHHQQPVATPAHAPWPFDLPPQYFGPSQTHSINSQSQVVKRPLPSYPPKEEPRPIQVAKYPKLPIRPDHNASERARRELLNIAFHDLAISIHLNAKDDFKKTPKISILQKSIQFVENAQYQLSLKDNRIQELTQLNMKQAQEISQLREMIRPYSPSDSPVISPASITYYGGPHSPVQPAIQSALNERPPWTNIQTMPHPNNPTAHNPTIASTLPSQHSSEFGDIIGLSDLVLEANHHSEGTMDSGVHLHEFKQT